MAGWATRLIAALLGAALTLGVMPGALASGCLPPEGTVDHAGYGPEVELVIAGMTSLPAGIVILAGHFHDGANTVQPALVISRDGGSDWTPLELPFAGAGLGHLTTDGEQTVWAVISSRQEGLDIPVSLLRSRDGGESWCAIALDGMATLNAAESLRFFDSDHGIMIFTEAPFGTARSVYHTADGGDTWQRLWQTDPAFPADVESEFALDGSEPLPHAPVWRRESDRYRIVGLLRLRSADEDLLIERRENPGPQDWVRHSRIDRYRPTAELTTRQP